MSGLIRWSPYEEMARLRDEFTQTFAPFWGGSVRPSQMQTWGPSVDVKETDTQVQVSAEIPGVDPEDIDVTVTDDSVVIRGEVKHEDTLNDQGFHRVERRYGCFQRAIALPTAVQHEQAKADYKNGILTLTLPKSDTSKAKSTQLRISTESPRLQ